jgi:hypothetical protein
MRGADAASDAATLHSSPGSQTAIRTRRQSTAQRYAVGLGVGVTFFDMQRLRSTFFMGELSGLGLHAWGFADIPTQLMRTLT